MVLGNKEGAQRKRMRLSISKEEIEETPQTEESEKTNLGLRVLGSDTVSEMVKGPK